MLWHNREMINLQPIIDRIKALLDDDTEASVTYAALEARLALEKVCYDRLRQRHDYISHEHLRRWQPHKVINTLIADVDANLTETLTLSISKSPARADVKPQDEDYVEVGTEIGFDAGRIVKMWNSLAGLALHVRMPKSRDDDIPAYGEKAAVRDKVSEVLTELERLAKGTMTFSGMGEEVSFVCSCQTKNKRRAALLREGQHVHCINPDCKYTWRVAREGDDFVFESVTADIDCDNCGATNPVPWRVFWEMKYDEHGTFSCHSCQHKNIVVWRLMQARRKPPEGDASKS